MKLALVTFGGGKGGAHPRPFLEICIAFVGKLLIAQYFWSVSFGVLSIGLRG